MAPKPIVRPGPTAEGPPGWEERQQERLSEATEGDTSHSSSGAESGVSHNRSISGQSTGSGVVERDDKGVVRIDSTTGEIIHHHSEHHSGGGLGEIREIGDKLKDGVHKIGEKLALVPPRDAEAGTATQNASTMPE